ncbi:MAG: glycoside hydrolase [Pseudomonadales bacterium]
MPDQPLKVVLYWHMHQPRYHDMMTGEYKMPWVYLHAIKDYVDMVAHLESNPAARVVVNFTPALLDQIENYATQVQGHLRQHTPIRDSLLAALASPISPFDVDSSLALMRQCLHANQEHVINRFAPYKLLAELAEKQIEVPETIRYVNEQFLYDLMVWYHLGWLGETVRRKDSRVQQLIEKKYGYTLRDRRVLLEIIGELLAGVIARYKALAQSGQIELSITPGEHPIVPLLLDINSARDAEPDMKLPTLDNYPGGEARSQWHIQRGVDNFRHHFDMQPQGCWPAEGGVSEATLKMLAQKGFLWAATGETVMHNSIARSAIPKENCQHQPYVIDAADNMVCFFRDDNLSDLIGFNYSKWHSEDAVKDLVHHLENIDKACEAESNRIVSIILDGENAWEHYPENGYYFLTKLYDQLAEHPQLQLSTYSDVIDQRESFIHIPKLVAGSWVYGTFSTWIGDPDKNHAWDILGEAKQAYDRVLAEGRLDGERLQRASEQLGICEASDWFWWLGDYNSELSVREFESLFRHHIANLYFLIDEEPPEHLAHPISLGTGSPEQGGTMRRGH